LAGVQERPINGLSAEARRYYSRDLMT